MSTEKQKAYQRAYYLAHQERIRQRTSAHLRAWRAANKEKVAERNKAYRSVNAKAIAEKKRISRLRDRQAEKEYSIKYHARNAEVRNAKSRAWYAKNKERVALRHSKWAKENSHICASRTRRYDAMKLRAMPIWADKQAINAFYERAAYLTRITGVVHTVDHIIPLQGKNVCGFHHEGNLQILTRSRNSAKHNKFPEFGLQQDP